MVSARRGVLCVTETEVPHQPCRVPTTDEGSDIRVTIQPLVSDDSVSWHHEQLFSSVC